MTAQEMQDLADKICEMTPGEIGVFGDMLFDTIEATKPATEVHQINEELLNLGVDVRPLCKKKHPA